MKQIAIITAAALALSLGAAQAQTKSKNDKTAQLKASCEKQAAQKFAFYQFLSRRDFVKKCTGDKA